MDKRDLSKLKRSELLEIMLAQSEEIDRLRAELAQKDQQLQDREIAIANAGSIAEAALGITKVFDEAQKAADLYLDNVRRAAGAQPQSTVSPNPAARSTQARTASSQAHPTPAPHTANPRHLS